MAEMTPEEAVVLVDRLLGGSSLSNVQEMVVRQSWQGYSYQIIADSSGYTPEYIKAVAYKLWKRLSQVCGKKVTCHNLRSMLRCHQEDNAEHSEAQYALPPINLIGSDSQCRELSSFALGLGRTEELQQLQRWILSDQCRLIGIYGMAGQGKTTLVHMLVQQIHHQFERVIWRNLREPLSLQFLLRDLIQILSDEGSSMWDRADIPSLLTILGNHRCLLILDQAESILQNRLITRSYRPGFENYHDLLESLIQTSHQSCVVVISRDKFSQIALHEGKQSPTRSLLLPGIPPQIGKAIMQDQYDLIGSDQEWEKLISAYAENPLILKFLGISIQEVFSGNLTHFWHYAQNNPLAFGDIYVLLKQEIDRLAEEEIEILTWLAIRRDPSTINDLREDILSPTSRERLLTTIQSLRRRALIDPVGSSGYFTLSPILMDTMVTRLVEKIRSELSSGRIEEFTRYALVQAQAKDYVREIQIRLILEPITQFLLAQWGSLSELGNSLNTVLLALREHFSLYPHYGGGNLINLLRHLHINLTGYDFSHLTIWQADLRGIPLHQVNFRGADLSRSVFPENLNHFVSVAISPDGSWLAMSNFEGEVCLWQMQQSRPGSLLRGHVGWVWSMAFSPDSRWLVSGGSDQTVRIWDLQSCTCVGTLRGHTDTVRAVAFSPDGLTLASGSQDHTVKLWDLTTGQCLRTLAGHGSWVWSVDFSPDGLTLASGSQDHTVKLWDPKSGQCLRTLKGHTDPVLSVSFSPNSAILASSGEDQTIRLWDVHSGTLHRVLSGHGDVIWCVAFDPHGAWVVSGSQDRSIKVWDIVTGECVQTLKGHSNEVYSVAFGSMAGQLWLASGSPQSVKVWDIRTGRCAHTLHGHHNGVISATFAGTDPFPVLISGSQDNQVKLWDPRTGQCVKTLQGHEDWIWSVATAPGSSRLASGSQDQTIRIWDLQTGLCHRVLRGHTQAVLSVAFSPDGQFLASGSTDQNVRLWDPHSGHCLHTLRGHQQTVWSVAFSPTRHCLASASQDLTIKLWDILTGQCLTTLTGHASWVWSIAFDPQGSLLASGSRDRTIRLWDSQTGQCIRTLSGHQSFVWSVAFSPNGQLLASASEDRTIRIWDVNSGQCVQTLEGHHSWVWSVAFSPDDDNLLVSSSQDETTRLWDLRSGSCVQTLHSEGIYQGMNISETTGLSETQRLTLIALGAIQS